MKMKLLSVILVMVWAPASFSQSVAPGTLELGGSLGFVSMSDDLYEIDGDSFTSISIQPRASYFVSQGLGLGLVFDYLKMGYDSANDITIFGFGPALTYYFWPEGQRTAPFIGASYVYEKTTSEGDQTMTTVELTAGVAIALAEHFALKIGAFYAMDETEYEADGWDLGDIEISGKRIGVNVGFAGFLF